MNAFASYKDRVDHLMVLGRWKSLAEMARAVGEKEVTFRQQRNRESVTKDIIDPLVRAARRRGVAVSERWLLDGKGPPPVAADNDSHADLSDVAIDHISGRRNLSVTVPELDVRAAMGGGAMNDAEDQIAEWGIPENILRAQTSSPMSALRIIQALGTSNEPDIPSGTRLVVDTSDRTPSPPGYFCLWDGIGLVVKRVEYLLNSNPPTLRLSSANPAFSTYERALDEVDIKGRVMGRWAWM